VINFHNKQNPAQGSLIGKFVFVEGGMHWVSLASPVMVAREMRVSLEGQRLNRVIDEGLIIATSVSTEDETKTIRRSSVACVCDTLEEVNAVLRANLASRNLYNASIQQGKELFSALNGTEILSVTVQASRIPNP
jgi:hypothetical protein